jgi:TonB family protein
VAAPSRRIAASLAIAASLVCVIGSRPHTQEEFAPIFNGTDLAGWEAVRTTAGVESGVIVVHEGAGWLRLTRLLANFVVRMDVKLLDPRSKARIFVRSWQAPDQEREISDNGYSVVVSGSSEGGDAAGRVVAHGRRLRELRFDQATVGQVVRERDAWHRYEIECVGSAVNVTLDGKLVTEVRDIQNSLGHVALKTDAGAVAFRNVILREVAALEPRASGGFSGGAYRPGSGIDNPILIREVKPLYTREALQAKIEGVVLLEAVVQPDGTVSDVRIVRSLDPHFGLDREAVKAAKKWWFIPGKRQGVPVPVIVTIELTFKLK